VLKPNENMQIEIDVYAKSNYDVRFWCEDLSGRDMLIEKNLRTRDNGGKTIRVEIVTNVNL